MTRHHLLAAGAAVLVAIMFALNLVGAQLNHLFLRFPGIDKVLHFTFHALLFTCLRALATLVTANRRSQIYLAAGVGLGLAFADEAVQSLNPHRSLEFSDIVAGVSGIVLAGTIAARPRLLVGTTIAVAALLAAGTVTYQTHLLLRDFNRALTYEGQGDFVRAREHYLRALAGGLETSGLYNGLGWVEIESGIGDARKAVEYAGKALAMQPDDADIHDTYGWALLHADRAAEALPHLLTALASKPSMFCIHYHLGKTYAALGQPDEAREHFRRQLARPDTREAALARAALAEGGDQP
jgi:tetratricopeptide (TPR) repeat protein